MSPRTGHGATWRPSPRPRPWAGSPTGTPWWRCSAGRSGCPSRTPPSSRATTSASPRSLGEFVETNFLAPEPVEKKLGEVDFAALIAEWLSDRERSAALARFMLQLLPQTLSAIDQSGLRGFLGKRIMTELERVELAPLAAGLADRRHRERPAPAPARRVAGRTREAADQRGGAGGAARENPRGAAGAVQSLSRRRVSAAQDRGLDQRLHSGGAGRVRSIRCAANSTVS